MKRGLQGVVVVLSCWLALGVGAIAWGASNGPKGQVNINAAGIKELQTLPFVGKTRARAIIRAREAKGGFASVEELRDIPEVGESTFLAIKPYLALSETYTPSGKGADASKVVATITTSPGEVKLLVDQEYLPTLRALIGQATASVDLVMFLFKPSDSPKSLPAALVNDLIAACRRGVKVSVLLERSERDQERNQDNEKVGARLKQAGATVRFDDKKTTTHAKVVVVDRRYSLVGSHNFTSAAFSFNHEASLLVDNETLAVALVEYMAGIE